MTLKDIKKKFKQEFGKLPVSKKKYIEIEFDYKTKQSITNKANARFREVKKLKRDFGVVCQFEGVEL